MLIHETALRDVKLLEPSTYADGRGWFAEVFNTSTFRAAGLPEQFVQDNQSLSRRGVLRGLHYQLGQQQGKLVRAVSGHIYDVAVDLRRNSPTFAQWAGFNLVEEKLQFLWIPEGFAHGFLALSETATVLYKTTALYYPPGERCIRWNDPDLKIEWPLSQIGAEGPILSGKDAIGSLFREAELPPA
ncbi:MAG: dTDP-4-dehydrorhamnose 3,5-epimerase [Acidobacteriaceae bacterium]